VDPAIHFGRDSLAARVIASLSVSRKRGVGCWKRRWEWEWEWERERRCGWACAGVGLDSKGAAQHVEVCNVAGAHACVSPSRVAGRHASETCGWGA
jgi:hypothetical protein